MEHQTITNIHIFNKMRKALFCLAAIMIAAVVNAQEHRGMRPQQREFNPEDMAAMQTNRMHQVVNLDSTQYQAIYLMNYADALTMQDSMKARRERGEKMRANGERPQRMQPSEEQMKARMELERQRREIRNERLKLILTPEQLDKYLKYEEEQRARMRERFQRR